MRTPRDVIAKPSYFFLSAFADAAKRLIVHRSRLLRSLGSVSKDGSIRTPSRRDREAVLLLFVGVRRCGETPDRPPIQASAKPGSMS
jgi:hypothetical protein